MCAPYDALPPIPPMAGAAVSHRRLVLEAEDGNRFMAFAGLPDRPSGAGVVVMPDIRGLFRFYEEVALRLAEQGLTAVAIDYFGRTAGTSERDEDFPGRDHAARTTPEGVRMDVAAAVAWLRSDEGGGVADVFTLGFCFGGAHSWLQAAGRHGLAGAIGFYGRPNRAGLSEDPGALQRAGELRAPILALMGGADAAIPPDVVEAFDAALDEAGVEHEVVTYPGAPHSFFDRHFEEHAAASEDAWGRTLDFIDAHRSRA